MNSKKAKRSGLVSYDQYRDNQLKDPEFAALYFSNYWNRTGSGKITSLGDNTRRMVREADARLAKGNRHPVKSKAEARKLLSL